MDNRTEADKACEADKEDLEPPSSVPEEPLEQNPGIIAEGTFSQTATAPFPKLFPIPALIITAAAFAVILPMFWFGIPSGHDFEFHMNSWMEVLGQWKQGIFYPRWASLAHYGYGEARFIFYPPASWTLGALLGAALPWKIVPGAYLWIVLTLAGFSMFLLARNWVSRRDAIFAAALYAANPYHIVIVYWRSAYAELLASALLPLLVLLVVRAEQRAWKSIISLALIVAAAWLTNAPSAVMVNYSLALFVVIAAIVQRSPRMLLHGAAGVVLGAMLACFYLLPAVYEEKWVNIWQVLSPGLNPQENFLFTMINDADHNQFNLLVSTVAVAEITLLLGAFFFSRRNRRDNPKLWWILAAWGSAAALLMLPFTVIFWQYLPKLRFIQLPWRWLLCLNVAFVLLITLGLRRWLPRLLVCALLLGTLAVVWHKQPPWWDRAADIAEMVDNLQTGKGYEGTDEYVPTDADPYEIKQDARKVAVEGGGKFRLHVQQWTPESKIFTVSVAQSGHAVLRLFNYPAWSVEVNDRLTATKTREVTGQMMIPLQPGENHVHIVFMRTRDRTLGAAISGASLLLVILLIVYGKWRSYKSAKSSETGVAQRGKPQGGGAAFL
jgi:hypothetical protein